MARVAMLEAGLVILLAVVTIAPHVGPGLMASAGSGTSNGSSSAGGSSAGGSSAGGSSSPVGDGNGNGDRGRGEDAGSGGSSSTTDEGGDAAAPIHPDDLDPLADDVPAEVVTPDADGDLVVNPDAGRAPDPGEPDPIPTTSGPPPGTATPVPLVDLDIDVRLCIEFGLLGLYPPIALPNCPNMAIAPTVADTGTSNIQVTRIDQVDIFRDGDTWVLAPRATGQRALRTVALLLILVTIGGLVAAFLAFRGRGGAAPPGPADGSPPPPPPPMPPPMRPPNA